MHTDYESGEGRVVLRLYLKNRPASACADYVTDAVTHRRNHYIKAETAGKRAEYKSC